MPDPEIIRRLDAAKALARAAGDRTLRLFRSPRLRVAAKPDGTAVTDADRDCERFLRDRICSAFPRDAVLGEEDGSSPGTSGYRWILDPIDGTTSFIHGVPLFGTLIAVEHEARAVAGVIHLPALDETVHASIGGGAWHSLGQADPRPARVTSTPRLREAMVLSTSNDYFTSAREAPVWEAIQRAAGATRGWSDCYAFVLIATGRADAALEPVVKVWDIAAAQVVLAEAGGRLTDWEGGRALDAPMCLASNGRLHDELLAVIRGARSTGRAGSTRPGDR